MEPMWSSGSLAHWHSSSSSSSLTSSSSSTLQGRNSDVVEEGESLAAGTVLTVAVPVVILLANTLLLALILSNRERRQMRCNMFMVSLGMADMAFVSVYLVVNKTGIRVCTQSAGACLASQILASFLLVASWYNFLGLNLDRLHAIKRPLDYGKQPVWKVICGCWVLALVPTLPLCWDTTIAEDMARGATCYLALRNKFWVLWFSSTGFILPTLLILVMWLVMAHHFTRHGDDRLLKSVSLKLCLITLMFLASLCPFASVFTLSAASLPENTDDLDWTLPIVLFNSMAQPILYISFIPQLRCRVIELLSCRKKSRPPVSLQGHSTETG